MVRVWIHSVEKLKEEGVYKEKELFSVLMRVGTTS